MQLAKLKLGNRIYAIMGLFTLFAMTAKAQAQSGETADTSVGQTVYEQRIYYTNEGKLDELLARFRNHTTGLFEKHGFTNVGYWITRPGEKPSYATQMMAANEVEEALLYIVSFPDMETRNKSWDAFVNDPEWIKVYEESRVNGALVKEIHQVFMNPTDFSVLK